MPLLEGAFSHLSQSSTSIWFNNMNFPFHAWLPFHTWLVCFALSTWIDMDWCWAPTDSDLGCHAPPLPKARQVAVYEQMTEGETWDTWFLHRPKNLLGSGSSCRFASFARKVDQHQAELCGPDAFGSKLEVVCTDSDQGYQFLRL